MHNSYNYPMPPTFAANLQANVEVFNAGQYCLNRGYVGAEAQPVQYPESTLPAYSAGAVAQGPQNNAFQLNPAPFCDHSYTNYSPTMEKGSYGFRQATFHSNYTQDETPANMPLHFAQPYIHDVPHHPENARATSPYNNIRWVNMDPTAAETGFKTPTRNATKAPAKKAPAKSSKGIKKPRYKLTVEDRKLLFRSCVTKTHDRCFWQGCKDIVFTDRGSIKEHMKEVHGLDITLKSRVDCCWKSCKKNLWTGSLFRHITNSHMHVVEAHCLYGCGEVFSRVDGRSRHMSICPKRPLEKSN